MTKDNHYHPSLLPLEGGVNFRDLGGNRGADGRLVKHNWLFRSGALDMLTEKDCQYLTTLPVTHIYDYRDQDEVDSRPDRLWQGVHYIHKPANPISSEASANLSSLTNETLGAFDAEKFMLDLYRQLPFNNASYRQLVNVLLQPEPVSLVQHCAVGKDRTGIGSALILFALGADKNTVMEDYLLTETTLKPFRKHLLDSMSNSLGDVALEKLDFIMSAREQFLATALEVIGTHYCSTDSWLEQEFGLTEQKRTHLQSVYLEA